MATKYEAYLGDEMVGKRTTQSRTYTHAVVTQFDEDQAREKAYGYRADAQDHQNYEFHAELAALPTEGGNYTFPRRGHCPAVTYFQDAAEVRKNREFIEKYPTFPDYATALTVSAITLFEKRVEDGDFEPGVAGWCGRLDLAHKLAAKNEGQAWVKTVWIVPAMEV